MPLNLKVFLCTNHAVYDVNEKVLHTGKYFFEVDEISNNHVKGNVVRSNREKIPYEFRYYSFMLMMSKAQSSLARRANIKDPRMPKFDSPIVIKKKKKKTKECCICLLKIKATSTEKKLSCGHCFHTKCLKTWVEYNSSCPLCRVAIEDKK